MKITHDLHIHTTLSSCCKDTGATVQKYMEKARQLGLDKIAFTDHLWDSAIPLGNEWYRPQNVTHVLQLKQTVEDAQKEADTPRILFGCETEYDYAHRAPALTEEAAAQFDIVLFPNSHTHLTTPDGLRDDKKAHARFMFDAFMDAVNSPVSRYITVMAHPFMAVCCPYDNRELLPLLSDNQYRECFSAAKEKNIAIEINMSNFKRHNRAENPLTGFVYDLPALYNDPILHLFELAKGCGCRFTFGSDAHAVSTPSLNHWHATYMIAELLGLTDDDIADIAK